MPILALVANTKVRNVEITMNLLGRSGKGFRGILDEPRVRRLKKLSENWKRV